MKKILEQFDYLSKDIARWKLHSIREMFYAFFEQGIWATVFYRISRMLFLVEIPLVKTILRLIAFFIMKFSEYFLGAAIKPEAQIGPGLYVGHVGLIRVHPKAVIGKNFSIGPGVIIGQKGLGAQGVPVIGDDVYVGTGAKILGPVTLGHHVNIGANAVVVKDISDGSTAVGIPAKIIKTKEDRSDDSRA